MSRRGGPVHSKTQKRVQGTWEVFPFSEVRLAGLGDTAAPETVCWHCLPLD